MRFSPVLFVLAIAAAGCGGGGHATSIPAERTAAAPSSFAVPSRPVHAVPARKTLSIPALPKSIAAGPPAANAARPSFFNGEAALSNGVYYLAFQNGTPFGYYSYLSDPHYVFHFDLGYQYYFDSTDPNTQYLYDFPSGHFWYTGANLWPYVYDFTLNAFLYYYPDTQNAGHYTTNPRYFYNFGTNQIIRLPDPLPPTDPNCPTGAPLNGSTYTLQSNPSGVAVQRIDPSVTNKVSVCFAALTSASDTPPTAPHGWNYVFAPGQASPYVVTVSQQLNGNHTLFYNQAGDSTGGISVSSLQSIRRSTSSTRAAVNEIRRGIRRFSGPGVASGQVLVRFRGSAAEMRTRATQMARTANATAGAEITTAGGSYERFVSVPAGTDATTFAAKLRAQSDVADVFPVHTRFALGRAPTIVSDTHMQNNTDQWYLFADGFPNAWSYANGANAKIALIDTGIDLNNTDLMANYVTGHSYYHNSQDCSNSPVSNTTPQDTDGHGTNTAGIAAAATNNSLGFAGGGDNVKLLAYDIFAPGQGFACVNDEVQAINAAVAAGADVISLSIGAAQGYDASNGFDQAEHDAVEAAIAAGVTVVAAAGNNADGGEGGGAHTVLDYPAAYDSVISVGATGLQDNGSGQLTGSTEYVTSYSQYGPGLSVVAPGGDATDVTPLHWIWNYSTTTASDPSNQCSHPVPATSCTAFFAGTSQATPQVAAAAALLTSAAGGHHSLTPARIKQLIEGTADNINDPHQGHGRLNAYKAIATLFNDTGAYSGPTSQKTSPSQVVAFAYNNSGANKPNILDLNYPAGVPVDATSGGFRIGDVAANAGNYRVGVWYDANGNGTIDAGDQFGSSAASCNSGSKCAIGTVTMSAVGAGFTLP
ncbi:MAG: peptidase [Candidatus Eremiobacteraeota bacterium]|nr:peptidase [Candidatus Eremiobacteraeota bacterium]